MKIQKKLDWLLVFYISHIREYMPVMEELLKTIEQCRMGDHNQVWVIAEKVQANSDLSKATFALNVSRLEVSDDKSFLKTIPLSFFGVSDPDRASWKKVFTYLYRQIDCQRRILFTWSHGAGFGIHTQVTSSNAFNKDLSYRVRGKKEDTIVEVLDGYQYLSKEEVDNINENKLAPQIIPVELKFGEYQMVKSEEVFDCSKAEILWMSDLAVFLQDVLQGEKIDLLVMMNCNMQLFENGFLLREAVKVLIGSETKMWVYGYDYKNILDRLSSQPAISNELLAKEIVEGYVTMHQNLGHQKYLDTNIVIANSLHKYESLKDILQETTAYLLANWEQVKPVILNLRNNYFFSVSGREVLFLLDIKLWVDTLFQIPEIAMPNKHRYQDFIDDVEKTVLAKHIGAEFTNQDKVGPPFYGASVAGLFFPLSDRFSQPRRYIWCEYFSGQRSSSFRAATLWDEFIRKLIT